MGTQHRRLRRFDNRLMGVVPVDPSRPWDSALPDVSRVADHGVVWLALVGSMGLARSRPVRRAALRGLAAQVLASATANPVGKSLVRRARPAAELNPPQTVSPVGRVLVQTAMKVAHGLLHKPATVNEADHTGPTVARPLPATSTRQNPDIQFILRDADAQMAEQAPRHTTWSLLEAVAGRDFRGLRAPRPITDHYR
jgi:hypothetical protein